MNARFWVFINGSWAKLTLRPDQKTSWWTWQRTDEGWASEAFTWIYDGHEVLREYTSEAVDCDGRLDRFQDSICPVDKLRSVDMNEVYPCSENVGILAPEWQKISASQHDYNAEAAGY